MQQQNIKFMKSRNIQTRLGAGIKGKKLSQEWGLIAERLFY